MHTESVKAKLMQVIQHIAGNDATGDPGSDAEILHVILSESHQALALVVSIEDEFGIEFDDDEVDLGFFTDLDVIVERVQRHLGCKTVQA